MRYAFAHRGGRAHGADNVVPTFTEALARGATGLETDAWVTADGVVVLDHDGIHRRDSDDVPIGNVRRSELRSHVPTLAELYEACGSDFDLAIDVKGAGSSPPVLRVAQAHGAAERLWLFTPSSDRPGDVTPAHAGVTVRGPELLRREVMGGLLDQFKDDGVEVVNARWPWWRRSAVDQVHAFGMLAFAWDVQRAPAVARCRRIGIDGIFSDHVDLLHSAQR